MPEASIPQAEPPAMSRVVTEGRNRLTEYLTTREVAAHYRKPLRTIQYWRQIGYGPKGVKVGKKVLYTLAEVEKFDRQLAAENGAQPDGRDPPRGTPPACHRDLGSDHRRHGPVAARGRYDELRKRYPEVSPEFFDLLEERARAERALADLHAQLAHLVGYHDDDDAVPVAKIRALVPGLAGGAS